jgi:hypothetical protein
MVGDAGACFGQSATIAACHQLAFDVANAAGAGGKLRDLSLLAEDTAACGNGDTVACVSLGAHATDALAARGQPGDQPAGTGGVQRCGHADPAACATYGAAITAREKESNRNALLDVASCRLFGGDLSSNACAYLGWAAARAADQLLPGTRAALCLTEGIPSSLPPAAQPANAELSTFGSSTHLYVVQTSPGATGSTTGSYVGQISPVVVPASSNSGGMVGQISPGLLPPTPPSTPSNQLYPGYGHGCELFGRDLAGTAGPVEVSGLREKIAIAVKAARQNDGSVRLVGAATSAAATKAGASTSKHNIRPE